MFKEEVCRIVEDYKMTQHILIDFNATFLTLISKREGANSPRLFILISLFNIIYKIVMKVIDIRLSAIMLTLISPKQSWFVEGHHIMDGIILCMTSSTPSKLQGSLG